MEEKKKFQITERRVKLKRLRNLYDNIVHTILCLIKLFLRSKLLLIF